VGGVDWPLDWPSISLHGWGGGDTRVSPQPWREIDAHEPGCSLRFRRTLSQVFKHYLRL